MITDEMEACDRMGSRIEANNSKILILINITEGVNADIRNIRNNNLDKALMH